MHFGDVRSGPLDGLLAEVSGLFKATIKTTPTATEQSPPNAGCGVQEWSRASYGEDFNLQDGGVFAMEWDENGIAVCEFLFYSIFQFCVIFLFRCCYPWSTTNWNPRPSSLPLPPPSSPLHM
ncbi:hypothetical protein K435DRAFT_849651 [Dendrothele bispora CBS 962.96]|uniref:Uncharacterized protein n=1 Tax=Dendrothele bispora (strain CBS 962.96) TaxID=1314807 RepID=A0A4S8MS32_DENBC|nr:hypothetical protein K435DRAFT_849651 [Dendrothele bispora CBS 962.96]